MLVVTRIVFADPQLLLKANLPDLIDLRDAQIAFAASTQQQVRNGRMCRVGEGMLRAFRGLSWGAWGIAGSVSAESACSSSHHASAQSQPLC